MHGVYVHVWAASRERASAGVGVVADGVAP